MIKNIVGIFFILILFISTGVHAEQGTGVGDNASGLDACGLYGYDGTNWESQFSATTSNLSDIYAINSKDVWAVGNNGTVIRYDGFDWYEASTGVTENFYGVAAASTDNVWIVGASGTAIKYDGSTFNSLRKKTFEDLNSLAILSDNNILCVGNAGTILRYDGSHFVDEESNTTNNLYAASGLSSTGEVWVVGAGGTILYNNELPATATPANILLNTEKIIIKRKNSATITATVVDADNNPLSGINVEVSKISGKRTAISIDPQTETTDANGEATFTIYGKAVTGSKKQVSVTLSTEDEEVSASFKVIVKK